ncbi:TonB-dependent receptor plug domain-containing protein [Pseudoalteromonas sp. SWXJZ10B]|uniref:TonB-dependent receptor plug domain-containing protein n=1 Tax=Pseudoalteromonas sp. SWXJZ10B TaxID=2792063 RepID=UPI0018CE2042|nr:TonB-dependent receptor [Pseudoalteromonas sp. SWXJZ10B]MBH0044085.1 TonB-dependent receptor [Pseudoalteromonas sp. SWXJZ10B]
MLNNKISKAVRLAIAFGTASTAVFAANSIAAEEGVEKVERIEVTGSRIKRFSEVSPTPVTTITGEELSNAGITNISDLLQKLPSSGVGSAPTTTTNTIFGAGINTTDLRQLGEGRTLVLVNGRRYVGASVDNPAVDLNGIPTEMIERMDIVHGGASAVYGSDAIAGVVNIILKKSQDTMDFNYKKSITEQSGGEEESFSFTFGGESDKISFITSLSYSETEQLEAQDRDFLRNPVSGMLNPDNVSDTDGIPQNILATGEFAGLQTLGYYDRAGDAFLPDGHVVFGDNGEFSPVAVGGVTRPAPNNQLRYFGDGFSNGYKFIEHQDLATPLNRFNVFTNIVNNYADDHSMNFEVSFSKASAYAESSPIFLAESIRSDNAFLDPAAKAQLDEASRDSVTIYKLASGFGNRTYEDDRTTLNTTLSFQGLLLEEFDYEVYFSYGRNKNDTTWNGEFLTENFNKAIDAVEIDGAIRCADRDSDGSLVGALDGCQALSLFGLNGASQEALDYVTTSASISKVKQQQVIGGVISGYAFDMPAGGVSFALSAEHRKETGSNEPGAAMQNNLVFGNFVKAWDGEFTVDEIGVEMSVPLLVDAPFVDSLSLELAARYMDYSSVGDNVAWKVGFNYAMNDELRFRGTKSKSVRAPSLSQLYSAGTQSFASYGDPCDQTNISTASDSKKANLIANCQAAGIPNPGTTVGDWRPSDDWRSVTPPSVNSGNANLQEETSDDTLFGVIYTPTENITLIADYWSFDVEDAINSLGAQRVIDDCYEASSLDNSACDLVDRDPTTLDISEVRNGPYNLASYSLKGVDLEGTYKYETSYGSFNFRLLASYLEHREFNTDVSSEGYEPTPTVGEVRYPRWQGNLTVGYTYDDLYVGMIGKYRHSTVLDREWTAENNNYNDVPSYTEWSINGRYTVSEMLEVRLGVSNLFDITPPRNPGTYDDGEFFDVYGRRFNLGLNLRF